MSLSLKSLLSALVVGGSLLSASAARAETPVAMLGQAPVAVTACDVNYRYSGQSPYDNVGIPSVTGVDVRFQNQRPVDATEVDLQVAYGGRTQTLVENGRFSESTTIARTLGAFDGDLFGKTAPDRCDVVAVHYADGSVWQQNAGLPVAQATANRK
jgi:hypothetical protein